MGEIVNLRRERKRKARDEQDVQAAANRAKFGQSKVERDAAALNQISAERHLDAHRREPGDDTR